MRDLTRIIAFLPDGGGLPSPAAIERELAATETAKAAAAKDKSASESSGSVAEKALGEGEEQEEEEHHVNDLRGDVEDANRAAKAPGSLYICDFPNRLQLEDNFETQFSPSDDGEVVEKPRLAIICCIPPEHKNLYSLVSRSYDEGAPLDPKRELTRALLIAECSVPVDDDPSEDISVHFRNAIAFARKHISENRPIIVHCAAGVSRSSTVAIATLAALISEQHKCDVASVLALVARLAKRRRPVIQPNAGFLRQLAKWAAEWRQPGEEEDDNGDDHSAAKRKAAVGERELSVHRQLLSIFGHSSWMGVRGPMGARKARNRPTAEGGDDDDSGDTEQQDLMMPGPEHADDDDAVDWLPKPPAVDVSTYLSLLPIPGTGGEEREGDVGEEPPTPKTVEAALAAYQRAISGHDPSRAPVAMGDAEDIAALDEAQ